MYGTKVKINGTEYCCKTVLRLDTKGNYYLYDMDIEREIKKEDTSNASTPVTTTGRALKDISLIENSIPWWRKEVNEKLLKDSSNDVLKQEGTNTIAQEQMNAVKEQYYGTEQWMKAPDGTNTQLTEEQWLYAHTEAFKEKYGDWEYAAQQKILKKQEPIEINPNGIVQGEGESKIKSAVNAFTELYPKGANVYSVIGDIRIDANSIKDSLSHKFSLGKYQACLSLVKGMNQAAYMGQMPDLDGNKDVTNEFFAFKVTFNGKNLYAICRTRSAFGNHRLYLHEVGSEETIKKWSKPISWPPGDNQVQLRGIALYSSILAQFTQENNTLNCSLTENGEPDFSKINDDTAERYNQAAGVNAETADMPMLQKALDLYREGIKDAEEIFAETGWHIGLDGKWRFEVLVPSKIAPL